jgi:uncharacterized protein with FMN-binding domain
MRSPMPLPRLLTVLLVTGATIALIAAFRNTPHVQKGRLAAVAPRAGSPPPARRSSPRVAGGDATRPTARTVQGASVTTRYGQVQVQLRVRGGRIVSITNLALPFDRSRSQQISHVAGPLLRSEALRAQSARIDVVSGATYTSDGYAQSLQSALDRARA